MIEGKCPVCRRAFKVEDRYAGMSGRCKTCGAEIHVPGRLDEGLDDLQAAAAPAQQAAPPQERKAPAEPSSAQAPAKPGEQPHPTDDLARPHDARARYEPSHGPTTLEGAWVKEEAEGQPKDAQPTSPAPEPSAPTSRKPGEMLGGRLVSEPVPEPSPTQHRPLLLTIACLVLAALAVGFAAHFATAGTWGKATAALGVVLGAVTVVRLWGAHWDGVLAAVLFCLCVALSALFPCPLAPMANRILIGASAFALLLLLASILRRSGRDYFTT